MGQVLSNIITYLFRGADDQKRPVESHHHLSQSLPHSPCKSSGINAALLDTFVVPSSARSGNQPSPDCIIFIPPSSVDFVTSTNIKNGQSPSSVGSSSSNKPCPDCTIFIPPSRVDIHVASANAENDQSPSIASSSNEPSRDGKIFIPQSIMDFHVASTNAKNDQSPSSAGSGSGNEPSPDCDLFIPPSSMDSHVVSTDAENDESPSFSSSSSSNEPFIVDFYATSTDATHNQSPSSAGSDSSNEVCPDYTVFIPPSTINLHEASTTMGPLLDQNQLVSKHCLDTGGALWQGVIKSSQSFNPISGSGTSDALQQDMLISLPRVGSDNLLPFSNSTMLSDPSDVFYKIIEVVEESTPVIPSLCELNLKEPSKKKKQKISKGVTTKDRWIKHYSSGQKILLVGEGDFSFSASLAVAFGSATNMIATSLNLEEFLRKNYKKAMSNIQNLRKRGCIVIHGVDATVMASQLYLEGMIFDRIIFNFPHAGFIRNESRKSQLWRNRKLIDGFLENAKEMINEKGEIHITHKTNGFFLAWDLQRLASNRGLILIEKVNFDVTDYPGYGTKYGFGGDKCFDCNPSKTYKFGL